VACGTLAAVLLWSLRREPRPAVTLSAEERAWIASHGPIRLGADPAYPPIEWIDVRGVHRGLVADLLALVRARVGIPIEVVRAGSWQEVLEKARSGELDGITALQPTPERSGYLAWSNPIVDLLDVVIVRQDEPGSPMLRDLAGKRVAMTGGSALVEEVRRANPDVTLVLFPDEVSALRSVSFGQVDAALVNLAVASYVVEAVGITNLRVASDYGRGLPLSIGTRHDRPFATSILDKGLAAVSLAEREEIRQRWVRLDVSGVQTTRRSLLALAISLIAITAVAAVALGWNASLRRRVAVATSGLKAELAERRRAEEALLRAQRLESLAVLAGGIAHDFNNLLTGILGNLSLVRRDRPGPDEADELLDEAERATRRAVSLTRQLLTFARGGAPDTVVLDLAPLVDEAAQFAARGRAVTCRVVAQPGLWPAAVDPGQIGQVIQNLVLNAVEAMPSGGAVEIALDNVRVESGARMSPGPCIRLRVSDQGPGIPPDVLPHVFDPFVSTKQRGSGLGLAVTYSVVTRHGGTIDVRSRPGEGTTFEIVLPARPGASSVAPARAETVLRRTGRVLVMDDEESVRRVAQRVLRSLGCEVAVAADGREAVALWHAARERGKPFDVVVVDLTVPGGPGGIEVLRRLRESDRNAKVVVSTGYSEPEPGAMREFSAALPKPYSAEEALAVVGPFLPLAP